MEILPDSGFPHIAKCEPVAVKVEIGKIYAWCSCGLSEKQPFCDGKHKTIEGMPFKSVKVEFSEEKEVWFCQCKQTKTPPFCDGSYNTIDATIESIR